MSKVTETLKDVLGCFNIIGAFLLAFVIIPGLMVFGIKLFSIVLKQFPIHR
jgi:hypothetical protein